MQPDSYSEGLGTVQDPHVPGTLKWDIRHIRLYGRQKKFCCLREYRGQDCQDSGAAHKVVFDDHADHLVSESPCVPRQNLRIQMSYGSASHIISRWQLLPRILIKPLNGGESPLHILEGKGKRRPHLPSPWLGTGVLQGPGPSKFCLQTCLNPLAQEWPSPTPPVSIGAGVSEQEGPVTGASSTGGSSAGVSSTGGSSVGVSWVGAVVAPILGPLGSTIGPSACQYNSSHDSLGFGWGHLGNGALIKWGHSWTWPCSTNNPWK